MHRAGPFRHTAFTAYWAGGMPAGLYAVRSAWRRLDARPAPDALAAPAG